MGQPVVHFEIVGKDGEKLRGYYAELFGWEFASAGEGPTDYEVVPRDGNVNADGIGIGGGVGSAPEGYPGHVTSTSRCPTSRPRWQRPRSWAGRG